MLILFKYSTLIFSARDVAKKYLGVLGFGREGGNKRKYGRLSDRPECWPAEINFENFKHTSFLKVSEANILIESILTFHNIDVFKHHQQPSLPEPEPQTESCHEDAPPASTSAPSPCLPSTSAPPPSKKQKTSNPPGSVRNCFYSSDEESESEDEEINKIVENLNDSDEELTLAEVIANDRRILAENVETSAIVPHDSQTLNSDNFFEDSFC